MLLALSAASACRPTEAPIARDQRDIPAAAPAAPGPAPKPATVAVPVAAAKGCADAVPVRLDALSFASNGGDHSFSPDQLEAFRTRSEMAFRAAADGLCRAGRIKPAAFATLGSLEVETASGAMEPTFFVDEQPGGNILYFQWPFAEADLGLPNRKAIELGLNCWSDPKRKECADRGD